MLLAERGAKVVVNNRIRPSDQDQGLVADEVVRLIAGSGGTAMANTGDVGTQAGAGSVVQTALDAFGRVDIVVNNAGIVHFYKFADYPDDEFDRMFAIQLRGTWFVTKAAWPHMQAQHFGRVINTVSRGAFFGDPRGAAYAAAKGATYGLTRALAVEGHEYDIKVNSVAPTAWTPLYARAPDVSPERRKVLEKSFRTDLVSPLIVALAHSSCPFTGEVMGAAGGNLYRSFMAQTQGAEVGDSFEPEQFYDLLPEIWSEEGYHAIGLVTSGTRGQGTPVAEVPAQARPGSAPLRRPTNGGDKVSEDHVYRITEIVGSSEDSIEDAIQNAINRARKTLRHLDWFVVTETRGGLLDDGSIGHYQVTLKLGFRLED
jgi:NAD(P)-dependent dehydrogenase (short-subunit alcohol dehydrogenase family)/flavin-binding protein dodecin